MKRDGKYKLIQSSKETMRIHVRTQSSSRNTTSSTPAIILTQSGVAGGCPYLPSLEDCHLEVSVRMSSRLHLDPRCCPGFHRRHHRSNCLTLVLLVAVHLYRILTPPRDGTDCFLVVEVRCYRFDDAHWRFHERGMDVAVVGVHLVGRHGVCAVYHGTLVYLFAYGDLG